MISVRLPEEMEARIDRLSKMTQRPKSFFIREAIANYLEDMEDYYEALKRQKDDERNLISIEELERALDLQPED